MVETPSTVKLYGTDEPVEPMQALNAGPLSCYFDQGALRFIKIDGKEAIRNIALVVRDKDWGTYPAIFNNVSIEQHSHSFTVSFDALAKDQNQEIQYTARITGALDGTLSFKTTFTTVTDFVTNRAGFVVLHPISGVAGQPVTVETIDGNIRHSTFPDHVDPVQPFKNIRALSHEVLPGVRVCCRMTGDTFEMEDHRQWNDASYKTYVRPLGLPWPYTIPASQSFQQAVELSIQRDTNNTFVPTSDHSKPRCVVTISETEMPDLMPRIGLGLEPQHMAGALEVRELLKKLAPQQIVFWYEMENHTTEHLEQVGNLCHDIVSDLELQVVIPDAHYKEEIAELVNRCQAANIKPQAIHISPAKYLSSIMPGPSWPDVTDLAEIYKTVRLKFPDAVVGGGMLAFFPELNRHRPPIDSLDFVSHASNTITHACDDISVTENLEALPFIIKTCRAFAGDKPYHVGPSSIAMRFNPYGSKTMDNPDNSRIAMARMDPRQRGLINSAWTTGYASHMIRGDVDCLNLHAPTGEFGIFNHPESWQRPYYDDTSKPVFPVYHILQGLISGAGKPKLQTCSTMSREVEAFGYEDNGKQVVWVANLTSATVTVEIKGLKKEHKEIAILDESTFEECTNKVDGFRYAAFTGDISDLTLTAYSVISIRN